jgi:hypothetical protein
MKRVIDLKKLINLVNTIYEDVTDIEISQNELEDILNSIDKINLEYNRGKISKEIFDRDGKKFKKESVKIIQDINKLVSSDLSCLNLIKKEITPKKITKSKKSAKSPKLTKKIVKIVNQNKDTAQLKNDNNVGNNGNQQNLS